MIYNAIKPFLKFTRCDKGSVMLLGAIAILVLIIAAGIAIDMSRVQTAKTELYGCLDTAGLAAMAKISTPPAGDTVAQGVFQNVQTYFLADCRSHYLQTSNVAFTFNAGTTGSNTVNVTLSADNSTLTLDSRLNEATEFMPVAGIRTVEITGHSVISRSTGGIELALVLDNTGSMAQPVNPGNSSIPKITALKCALAGDAAAGSGVCDNNSNLASIGLLDILYGNSASQANLFTGVVPFSDMVNVNATVLPGANFIDTQWTDKNVKNPNGCVDARNSAYASVTEPGLKIDIADDAPVFASPSDKGKNPSVNPLMFQALPGAGNNDCPVASTHFMSSSKTDAVAALQNMTPGGNTMIQLGFAWGWRMLSPNWTGLWGNSATYTAPNGNNLTLPLPYNTQGMSKVVVLMTDGENTVPNNLGQNNAYETQTQNNPPNSVGALDKLTTQACTAMKNKGIIIYTIGFGPANGVNTSLLSSCATQGNQPHYFLAPTNAELAQAFQTIAGQLSNLVVSQ